MGEPIDPTIHRPAKVVDIAKVAQSIGLAQGHRIETHLASQHGFEVGLDFRVPNPFGFQLF